MLKLNLILNIRFIWFYLVEHRPLPSAGVRFLEARIRAPSRGRAAVVRGAAAARLAHVRAPGILKAVVPGAERRSRRQCGFGAPRHLFVWLIIFDFRSMSSLRSTQICTDVGSAFQYLEATSI